MNEESRPKAAPKQTPGCNANGTRSWSQNAHERARQRRREREFLLHVEPERKSPPSTYGMTAEQIRAYAARLKNEGWADWEIRARLANPDRLAA